MATEKATKEEKQSANQGKSTEGPSEPIMPPKALKPYEVPSP